ncbi:hypothetical protein [Actinacidiphila oryziradicis]|nr:hypothetical protein [Actinacidiphila oryziradicis]
MSVDACMDAVKIFGVRAVLAYRPDLSERERRSEACTGILNRSDVINLLMGLPVGQAVPVAALSDAERRALKHVPRGVVLREGATVTRAAVQPLRVDLAVVPGRGWQSAMEQAERFTPFCARAALVDGPLRRRDDAIMQADFYGIGLLAVQGDEVEMLVPPRPFVRKRYTAAGWRFVEDVHRQVS